MNRNVFVKIFMTLTILLLVACAPSTSLTNVRKNDMFKDKSIDSIMVLGVAKHDDVRQHFEDLFVDAFQKEGVTAVPAYKIMPKSRKLTKENIMDHKEIIKETAANNHLGAVLFTHLVRMGEEQKDLDGQKWDTGPTRSYRDMGSYSVFVYREADRSPKRTVTRQFVRLRTTIYDTASEKRMWSASSASVDETSADTIFNQLIKAVMGQLKKDKLIER